MIPTRTILKAIPFSVNPWGIYFRDSEKRLLFAHISDHLDILMSRDCGFSDLAKEGKESTVEVLRIVAPEEKYGEVGYAQPSEPVYVVKLRLSDNNDTRTSPQNETKIPDNVWVFFGVLFLVMFLTSVGTFLLISSPMHNGFAIGVSFGVAQCLLVLGSWCTLERGKE